MRATSASNSCGGISWQTRISRCAIASFSRSTISVRVGSFRRSYRTSRVWVRERVTQMANTAPEQNVAVGSASCTGAGDYGQDCAKAMTPPRASKIQLRAATLGAIPGSGAVFVERKEGRRVARGMFYADADRRDELTALIRTQPDSLLYAGPVWTEGAYRKATFAVKVLSQGTPRDPMISFDSAGTVSLDDEGAGPQASRR
jgi:hypothetical protein